MNDIFNSRDTKETLGTPIQQMSKFEGWLKIELANRLRDYSKCVNIEPRYDKANYFRADVSFIPKKETAPYFVELKNIRVFSKNLQKEKWIKTIKDVRGVNSDIEKIIRYTKENNRIRGIVAVVMFLSDNSCDFDGVISRIKKCPMPENWSLDYFSINGKNNVILGVFEPNENKNDNLSSTNVRLP